MQVKGQILIIRRTPSSLLTYNFHHTEVHGVQKGQGGFRVYIGRFLD